MRNWIGSHHYSTWMIVASFILMAMLVHPSLAAYLLVTINVGLVIITREVARMEGAASKPCWVCASGGLIVIIIAAFFMLKVNWMAI